MANRFRFRLFCKKTKQMFNTNYMEDYELLYEVVEAGLNYAVMQSTGLTDRNGKEIYEGDVLSIFKIKVVVVYKIKQKDFESGFKFYILVGQKFMSDENLFGVKSITMENAEVMGNIYETPEFNCFIEKYGVKNV